jgi:hypothetical protein
MRIPKPAWGGNTGKAVLSSWGSAGIYKLQSGPPIDVTINELALRPPITLIVERGISTCNCQF